MYGQRLCQRASPFADLNWPTLDERLCRIEIVREEMARRTLVIWKPDTLLKMARLQPLALFCTGYGAYIASHGSSRNKLGNVLSLEVCSKNEAAEGVSDTAYNLPGGRSWDIAMASPTQDWNPHKRRVIARTTDMLPRAGTHLGTVK